MRRITLLGTQENVTLLINNPVYGRAQSKMCACEILCLCLIRTSLQLFFKMHMCSYVCVCVHRGNLSVYVEGEGGKGGKQISNPWFNPSSPL